MFAETRLRISRYAPRTEMPPHQHDTPSIGVVVNGVFLERIETREHTYSRGTASYCPAGIPHSQRFGATGVRQIIFTPDNSWLEYLADRKARLDEAPHARSATFCNLGDRLLGEMSQDDGFSTVACEGLMLEIIAAFGRHRLTQAVNSRPPPWLRAAREFMHVNACAPLSMARIAHEAGHHEIHLAREFRRFYGTSVGGYLRRLRSERAEQMLLKNENSISEIAHECGFSSHSHFCREFKARFGLTPSEYRFRNR